MEKVMVRIEGVSPLLQHRFSGDGDLPPEAKLVAGKQDYKNEWEAALYQLDDGTIYQPAEHLENSMIKAAANFQIPGKGKKTYKDLVKSAIFIDPVCIPHKLQDFAVDMRAVRVNRGRVIRQRPRFDKWALEFSITCTEPQLPLKVIRQIIDYAGQYVGIGDYRPKFGRFVVTKWEEV